MTDKETLHQFLGKYLLIQYDLFLHDILGKIQEMIDEGKSFDDIKLEFNYLPNSIGYKDVLDRKNKNAEMLNKVILTLLQMAKADQYVRMIGDDVDIDLKKLKEDSEGKKSSLIMLH